MGPYPELVTIVLICATALVVAVVLWRILAGRSSTSQRSGSLRLALDRLESDREEAWLELLERDHFPFVQFLRFVRKELGAQILEEVPEIDAALGRLKEAVSEGKKHTPGTPGNDVERATDDENPAIRAAAFTIVREIYGRPEWIDPLSDESRREIDRLIDGLTEEP